MTTTALPDPPLPSPEPLEMRLDQAVGRCREALRNRFSGFLDRLPTRRRTPQDWFDLLHGYPTDRGKVAEMRALKTALGEPEGFSLSGQVEQFALVQSVLAATPRVPALPVGPPIKHFFATMFAHMANPNRKWQPHDEPWRFLEMAQTATLRRYPAGQHDFEITGLPRTWLLRVNPLDVPRLLYFVTTELGGFHPLVRIHLNYWRPNTLMVLASEACRSYYLMAKSIENRPEIKGMMANSWFYSRAVGETSPHLAWMREFFVSHGAFVTEMELARPDTGYMTGSARRQRQFREGNFRPRVTLVLWRRSSLMDWAAEYGRTLVECPSTGGQDVG
ncbi:MAG: hypothetical protein H7840_03320 [Alphaproteobacteria bacterium]